MKVLMTPLQEFASEVGALIRHTDASLLGAALLALVAALLLRAGQVVLSVFFAVCSIGALGSLAVEPRLHWVYLLAWVPVAFIVQHAAYLATVRRVRISEATDESARLLDLSDRVRLTGRQVLSQAREANIRYFSFPSLGFRYGLPCVLILVLAVTEAHLLCAPGSEWCTEGTQQGAVDGGSPATPPELSPLTVAGRLGLTGAYVAVVLALGRRGYRRDITSGAAMWSAATLALGPILAIVVGLVLHPRQLRRRGPNRHPYLRPLWLQRQ